jgi:hypothetical protein
MNVIRDCPVKGDMFARRERDCNARLHPGSKVSSITCDDMTHVDGPKNRLQDGKVKEQSELFVEQQQQRGMARQCDVRRRSTMAHKT